MSDLIRRGDAVDAIYKALRTPTPDYYRKEPFYSSMDLAVSLAQSIPSAQTEPLTDKEQRIFLAAMEREEKVCEEVDRNFVREPYEDSLMRVCKEIRRKVKGALWT